MLSNVFKLVNFFFFLLIIILINSESIFLRINFTLFGDSDVVLKLKIVLNFSFLEFNDKFDLILPVNLFEEFLDNKNFGKYFALIFSFFSDLKLISSNLRFFNPNFFSFLLFIGILTNENELFLCLFKEVLGG